MRLFCLFLGVVGLLGSFTFCWLGRFINGGKHVGTVLREAAASQLAAAPAAAEAVRCLAGLPSEAPWLAIYGDSLARGVLFDVVTLLNGSAAEQGVVHPGHSANYSEGCTVMEARPPTNRSKCGGFEYGMPLPEPPASHRPGQVLARERRGGGGEESRRMRFTYRLKTLAWEPAFDEPWLADFARLPRKPDVLLLSTGIWDMQYPPGGDPARGLQGFNRSLHRFLAGLRAALGEEKARAPRIFWLTVTAVSDMKLPEWKRPLLSASRSRAYNELAEPMMRAAGVEVVDTFTSGLQHPEESKDGVHFPGRISRLHAQLFLRALCGPSLLPAAAP